MSSAVWHVAVLDTEPSSDMETAGGTLVSPQARNEAKSREHRCVWQLSFRGLQGDVRTFECLGGADATLGQLKACIVAASEPNQFPIALQLISVDLGSDLAPSERYRATGDDDALTLGQCGVYDGANLLVLIPNVADRRRDAEIKRTALNRCVRPAAGAAADSPLTAHFQYKFFQIVDHDRAFSSQVELAGALSRMLFDAQWSRLTELDLSFNAIDDKLVAALEPGLRQTGSLGVAPIRKLNLAVSPGPTATCRMGPAGAASLARALQGNLSLTSLDLSGHKIFADGATALADGLRFDSSTKSCLTHLQLSHNQIGPEGATALSQLFQSVSHDTALCSLQSLCLANNSIGDDGAKAFARSLCHTVLPPEALATSADKQSQPIPISSVRSLTSLDLLGNSIGDAGAIEIIEALLSNACREGFPELTTLDLRSNFLNPAPDSAFCQALGRLQQGRPMMKFQV